MDSYKQMIGSAPVVMVEFFATWCIHCQHMMPVIAQIRELLGDSAPIYQIDIDKESDLASQEGVQATPTFIIYKDGKEVWRFAGEIDGNVLVQKLEGFMN